MGRRLLLAAVVVATALFPALPAGALVTQPGPCHFQFDAGFTDVPAGSAHDADIDCIAFWDITVNTATFQPGANVTRWQMALFLTRSHALGSLLPSGASQGFQDISGLPADQQQAINQLAQLGVTSGVSPTRYDPHGAVTRWQMALFLTRLVQASAVVLPPPAPSAFTDLGGVSAEAQAAISQLEQLGISTGTSPTTFSPHRPVTREQMASFLARTLAVVWYLIPSIEAEEVDCDGEGNCTGSGLYWAGVPFTLRAGWQSELPFPSAAEEQEFFGPDTRVEILVDGSPASLTERRVRLDGVVLRSWDAEFPSGLSGPHEIEYVWYEGGEVVLTETYTFDFALSL